MKGKERDIPLANKLRSEFISRFKSNKEALSELIISIGDRVLDKLVYRFKEEEQLDLLKEYETLMKVATNVKESKLQEVYNLVEEVDDARTWINDNGKFTSLVYEALYTVFREEAELQYEVAVAN